MFNVNGPCDCGICAQGGDCCGRWFCWDVEAWHSGEPDVWWVTARWFRNI